MPAKVYILGSGASAEDGAPFMSELVDKTFWNFGGKLTGSDINLMGTWYEEDDLTPFPPVFELMDCFYGTHLKRDMEELRKTLILPVSFPKIDIEDFFTKIDNMLKGRESYGLNWKHEDILKVSKAAGFFFYHTLCYETGRNSTPPKHYLAFVEEALKMGTKHCIITFNYDMLLEAALLNHKMYFRNEYKNPMFNRNFFPEERLPWTYGVPFKDVKCDEKYRVEDEPKAEVYLLKMHGSFNWGLCLETKEMTMYSPVPAPWFYKEFYRNKYKCHGGSHVSQPLLIPPVREKDIDIPGLQKIWDKARSFLESAREVHIIGYSLPDVDTGAQELFSQCLKHSLTRLVLVNPNPAHRQKFKRILACQASEIHEYNSFKEYLINEYKARLN